MFRMITIRFPVYEVEFVLFNRYMLDRILQPTQIARHK